MAELAIFLVHRTVFIELYRWRKRLCRLWLCSMVRYRPVEPTNTKGRSCTDVTSSERSSLTARRGWPFKDSAKRWRRRHGPWISLHSTLCILRRLDVYHRRFFSTTIYPASECIYFFSSATSTYHSTHNFRFHIVPVSHLFMASLFLLSSRTLLVCLVSWSSSLSHLFFPSYTSNIVTNACTYSYTTYCYFRRSVPNSTYMTVFHAVIEKDVLC